MIGAVLATLIVVGAGVAAPPREPAGPPPPTGGVDREGLRRERQVIALLNRAVRSVQRADRACRPPNPFKRRTTFTDDPPSEALLKTLGVLRRPQSPEEAQLPRDSYATHLPAEGIYRQHVRIARSTSGRSYLVVAARNTNLYEPRPRRCAVALRRRFGRLIADRPARFRRAARRILDGVIRREWTARNRGPREGVFLFDYGPDGGGSGGGGVGVRFIRRYGMFGSSSASGQPTVVSGLVPDGVATLTAVFPREVSRSRYRPPKRYRRASRRTVDVQDNVVAFTVPRPAFDAYPKRMIWRDADGRVVRVVSDPRG